MNWEQIVATVAASAFGAYVAAHLGFRYALSKLKHERAFDRRLGWYEAAAQRLIETANKLNWALAADVAGVGSDARERAWAEAFESLVGLRGLELEAELFASNSACNAVREAVRDVTTVARSAWEISNDSAIPVAPSRLFEICYKMLYHAASRLAADVREHLELADLDREWRLYDREFRELREELAAMESQRTRPEMPATSDGN